LQAEITISGQVGVLREGEPVFIKAVNPNGAIYRFDLVYPHSDGSYIYRMKVGGRLGPPGLYTVWAIHSGMAHITEFTIAAPKVNEYRVMVGAFPYNIAYNITGGTVRSITADPTSEYVAIEIGTKVDGKMRINLPGGLIAKVFPDTPTKNNLATFVDSDEVRYSIIEQGCDVTLEIPFYKGSEKIEIVMSQLLGEYAQENNVRKGNSIRPEIQAEGREFALNAVANADRCRFSLFSEEKRFHIDAEGPGEEQGYFQIELPHEFLGGNYTVLVNGSPAKFEERFSNATGTDTTTIILQYNNGGRNSTAIDIIGTSAIPEFRTAAWPATIMLAAASAATAVLTINRAKR
jgi:hypothetical protein